jgi:hypothetical protein
LIKTAAFFWIAAERIQIPLILSRKEIPLFQMMILNQLPIFSFLDLERMYRRMLLIRRFEETVEKLFSEGRIVGTAHTCIGQEAIAVGVASALLPQDAITSTHRGHGHFLARGADPRSRGMP